MVSASPVLSVPCLHLCVSLGVLSVRCLPSCISLTGAVRLSGLVSALSPFICLPSFVSLCLPEWWCPPLRSCLCLVSLHLSPFMCLPECCCPPLRSFLCLVSLHVSPWVVVSASPVLSVPCLPSCVSLSGGVRLSRLVCALSPFSSFIFLPSCVCLSGGVRLCGLVCALSPFLALPSCVSLSGGVRLAGLVCALPPFMCLPERWCPPRRSCLRLVPSFDTLNYEQGPLGRTIEPPQGFYNLFPRGGPWGST